MAFQATIFQVFKFIHITTTPIALNKENSYKHIPNHPSVDSLSYKSAIQHVVDTLHCLKLHSEQFFSI